MICKLPWALSVTYSIVSLDNYVPSLLPSLVALAPQLRLRQVGVPAAAAPDATLSAGSHVCGSDCCLTRFFRLMMCMHVDGVP